MSHAAPPRFERPLRIRFGHCDPAGIVYFPQYLVMLNGLLEDWFTDGLGVSYAELLGPPVPLRRELYYQRQQLLILVDEKVDELKLIRAVG